MEELFKYYNLTECSDREYIFSFLNKLVEEGKITYHYNTSNDVIDIEDIDLSEEELDKVISTFDDYDVIEDRDMEDDEDDDDSYDEEYDEY